MVQRQLPFTIGTITAIESATMQSAEKYQIQVRVKTVFVPSQSDPDSNRFVFAYTVTITNTGSETAQLLTRHWIITDANNKTQEVKGEGVIGEQPVLKPGASFQYTSGTVIETPVGTMGGSYQMQAEDGTGFDAPIPPFTLAMPRTLH